MYIFTLSQSRFSAYLGALELRLNPFPFADVGGNNECPTGFQLVIIDLRRATIDALKLLGPAPRGKQFDPIGDSVDPFRGAAVNQTSIHQGLENVPKRDTRFQDLFYRTEILRVAPIEIDQPIV